MTGVRVCASVLVAALLLAGVSAYSSGSTGGACAAPEIAATPSTVKAGGTVHVNGIYFRDGCQDQWSGGESAPLKDQAIVLRVDGVDTEIGRVDSSNGTITTTVRIPASTRPGPAQLQIGYSSPITVTVT
jgi:hypothetical protein